MAVCISTLTSCNQKNSRGQSLLDEGLSFLKNENYRDALDSFRKAAEIKETKAPAYLHMALIYDENLNDMSNAVLMYQTYLEHETDKSKKAQAKRWLDGTLHIHKTTSSSTTTLDAASEMLSSPQTAQDSATHARHFELLRSQLTKEYEIRLADVKTELWATQKEVKELHEKNTLLQNLVQSDDSTDLLARCESNDLLITSLRTQLDEKTLEAEDAHKGHGILQTIITNLQTQLAHAYAITSSLAASRSAYTHSSNTVATLYRQINALNITAHVARTHYSNVFSAYINATSQFEHTSLTTDDEIALLRSTNKTLYAEIESLKNTVERYASDIDTTRSQYTTATAELARVQHIAATVKTTEILHTATPLYASFTGTIATLEEKIMFHEQERKNFLATLESLRTEITQKNTRISTLENRVEEGTPAPKMTQKIDELTEAVSRAKAIATLEKNQAEKTREELEKVRNGYLQLRREYEKEIAERKRLNTVLAQLRREPRSNNTADNTPVRPTPPRIVIPDSASTRNTPNTPTPTPQTMRTYTVQAGDSLTKISEKFYGNQSDWRRIFDANRDRISRPNQLRIDMVLRIP